MEPILSGQPLPHRLPRSSAGSSARRHVLRQGALLGLVVLMLMVSACGTSMPEPEPGTPTAPGAQATATLDQRIDRYIQQMSVTQQIGQLLMLAVYTDGYTSALDVPLQQAQVGSILFFPAHNGGPLQPTTLAGVRQLLAAIQEHATNPLLIATDEEGGGVDRLAPYYGPTPSPASLTATGDPQQAYQRATVDAQRLRSIGINVDLAPLADVWQGGALDQSRMFGTTPQQVSTFAGAFLDGLQQHGVAGTLKHWPGLGAVPTNPDEALSSLPQTQEQLNAVDFASFQALLAHAPDMIMVTHIVVPAYDDSAPASLSPVMVDGVLRGQLGYQGVVTTDEMEAGSIAQFMSQQGYSDPVQAVGEASVRAILAGVDMIECPVAPDLEAGVVEAVTQAVQSGRISPARLQQSVERIIRLKVQLGLLTLPPA